MPVEVQLWPIELRSAFPRSLSDASNEGSSYCARAKRALFIAPAIGLDVAPFSMVCVVPLWVPQKAL